MPEPVTTVEPIKMNLQVFATEPVAEPVVVPVVEPVIVPVTVEPIAPVVAVPPIEPVVPVVPVVEPIVEPVVEPIKPIEEPPVVEPIVEPEIVVPVKTVEELQTEINKLSADNTVKLSQANALLEAQKETAKNYETALNSIVEAKLADVPENYKELIPAQLNVTEKLEWLNKAEKSGIFKSQVDPNGIIIGKPFNPSKAIIADVDTLSASAKMAMAYGTPKTKGKK